MNEATPDAPRKAALTLKAIDPSNGKSCNVEISHKRMHVVATRSMGHARDLVELVPYALSKPTAIFEGLHRDADEDSRGNGWRCYCSVPEYSHGADGTRNPPYKDQVFLVFVNDKGIAYNWRWEKADRLDKKLPVDYENRFNERVL